VAPQRSWVWRAIPGPARACAQHVPSHTEPTPAPAIERHQGTGFGQREEPGGTRRPDAVGQNVQRLAGTLGRLGRGWPAHWFTIRAQGTSSPAHLGALQRALSLARRAWRLCGAEKHFSSTLRHAGRLEGCRAGWSAAVGAGGPRGAGYARMYRSPHGNGIRGVGRSVGIGGDAGRLEHSCCLGVIRGRHQGGPFAR